MLSALSDLIPVMLALSIASERLVAILKTAIPWLAIENRTAGQELNLEADRQRRLIVLGIALAACYVSAAFLPGDSKLGFPSPFDPLRGVVYSNAGGAAHTLPLIVMAFLATGGSAFWSSILGYASALKNTQQVTTASTSLAYQAQGAALGVSVSGTGVTAARPDPAPTIVASLAANRPPAPSGAPDTATKINSALQALVPRPSAPV